MFEKGDDSVQTMMTSGESSVYCRGVFITSTGTEQGKTMLVSGIAAWWQVESGEAPGVWKPVQSGVQWEEPDADSYRLKWGGGLTHLNERDLVTLTFADPLSPYAAAQRKDLEIDFSALAAEGASRLAEERPLVVEGAGGVAVPFTKTGTMTDLAFMLKLPLLIVANPLLGTISHTVTAIEYVRSKGIQDVAVIMGGLPPEENSRELECQENAAIISDMTEVPVLSRMPWLPQPKIHDPEGWSQWRAEWICLMKENLLLCQWLRSRLKRGAL